MYSMLFSINLPFIENLHSLVVSRQKELTMSHKNLVAVMISYEENKK